MSCVAQAGNPRALERLHIQVAEVGPPEQRLAAAVRLAQSGDNEGLTYLRELVKKRGRDHLIAARELALLDERDGLELLRQVADNRSAQSLARQLGCDGLGGIGEPPDARRLAGLFGAQEPSDPQLKQAAARAVVRISGRDPGLLSMQSLSWAQTALGDSNTLVRQSAAAILGENVNAGAVSLLTGLLKDGDPQVRRSAVVALGRRKDATTVLALQQSLQDADKGVRVGALHALLRLGETLKSAIPESAALRQALEALLAKTPTASSVTERVLAASVLWQLGDAEQLKRLQKGLTAAEPEVRRLTLEQLSLSADQLAALLTDKAAEVRYLAARKLAELRDPRAEPVLRGIVALHGSDAGGAYALLLRLGATTSEPDPTAAQLAGSDVGQRVRAIESLRDRPVAQALPLLQQAARDLEMLVRWTAAEVAVNLAEKPEGARVLPVVRRLAQDSDPMVRARAAALLARQLAPPSAKPSSPASGAAGDKREASSPAPSSPDGGTTVVKGEPGAAPPSPNPPPATATGAVSGREDAIGQIEKLVHAGLSSFDQKDLRRPAPARQGAGAMQCRDRAGGTVYRAVV